jgi:hypothetical protein
MLKEPLQRVELDIALGAGAVKSSCQTLNTQDLVQDLRACLGCDRTLLYQFIGYGQKVGVCLDACQCPTNNSSLFFIQYWLTCRQGIAQLK